MDGPLDRGRRRRPVSPVLDRWTITRYEPLRAPGGEVVGMLYAGLDEAPYVAAGRRNVAMFLTLIADGYAGEVPAQLAPRIDALRRAVGYGHEVALSFNQLSRAECEGFQARPRVVADFIAEIVRPALAEVEEAAAARGMTVTLQGEGGRVSVEGEHGSWIAFSITIPNAFPGAIPPAGVPTPAGTAKG